MTVKQRKAQARDHLRSYFQGPKFLSWPCLLRRHYLYWLQILKIQSLFNTWACGYISESENKGEPSCESKHSHDLVYIHIADAADSRYVDHKLDIV